MLRPCERSFNSGQMLRKLSPLNSTFDKSHYSLLSRAPYRSCIHFSDLYPHPSSLSLSLLFFVYSLRFSLSFFFASYFRFTSIQPSISRKFPRRVTVHQGRAHTTPNQIKIRSKFTNWRFNIQAAERPWIDSKDTLLVTSPRGKLAKAIVCILSGTNFAKGHRARETGRKFCGNAHARAKKK